jgi:hypothetical protein
MHRTAADASAVCRAVAVLTDRFIKEYAGKPVAHANMPDMYMSCPV